MSQPKVKFSFFTILAISCLTIFGGMATPLFAQGSGGSAIVTVDPNKPGYIECEVTGDYYMNISSIPVWHYAVIVDGASGASDAFGAAVNSEIIFDNYIVWVKASPGKHTVTNNLLVECSQRYR
jgi:hypothetical protein